MDIKKLIQYLQQKQKEGYTEVNVCLDGMKEYYICNLVDSSTLDDNDKEIKYVSLMVDTNNDEWQTEIAEKGLTNPFESGIIKV